jgi:hypothetical protein
MLIALALTALVISPGVRLVELAEEEAPAAVEEAPKTEPDALKTEPDAPRADTEARTARLLTERTELAAARPRILAPLLLTTGGILAGVSGLAFVYLGLVTGLYYAFSFAVGSVVLLSIGIVLFAAGIPLTTIGALKLHRVRKERREIDQRIEQLDREEAGMQTVLTF